MVTITGMDATRLTGRLEELRTTRGTSTDIRMATTTDIMDMCIR